MHYPAVASTIPLNNLAAFCYCMAGNPECQCGAVVMAVIVAVSVFAGDPVSNLGARSVHPGALALPLTHLPAPSCHHVTHPPPSLSCPSSLVERVLGFEGSRSPMSCHRQSRIGSQASGSILISPAYAAGARNLKGSPSLNPTWTTTFHS
ncbi:hypothetical protein CKAH01_03319 [Colletotrichum kahawae]|uniref:Uncharacterized protein n=1 Tax=Colletotrichum kahawae TaxID=34407 RepID=A0AAE0DCL5_COLKA|nr:hypothetical protein CKAH01_03319 [Colletotrichum kahawae]